MGADWTFSDPDADGGIGLLPASFFGSNTSDESSPKTSNQSGKVN